MEEIANDIIRSILVFQLMLSTASEGNVRPGNYPYRLNFRLFLIYFIFGLNREKTTKLNTTKTNTTTSTAQSAIADGAIINYLRRDLLLEITRDL